MILRFLIEKEFKLISRNSALPRMLIFMPLMTMVLMPFAANLEVKDIKLAVVDNDHSPLSARLTEKVGSSDYFQLVETPESYEQAMQGVEKGTTDIILEIPRHFERDMNAGYPFSTGNLFIAANAVNAIKGGMGSAYLANIVQSFGAEMAAERGRSTASQGSQQPQIKITPLNRFNTYMNYQVFMIPALVVMLLTILCGSLPTSNIVGEKESGTIEQMNVSPVGKFSFIFAKLVPYWIIGFVVLSICFLLAWLIYGLVPAGSLATIYVAAMLFILVMSGFGLIISNFSQTMQQANLVIFFFVMILMLISGLYTPVESMPNWAQNITIFNPLKYFIQVMRGVYLKGSSFSDVSTQLIALGSFAVILNTLAVYSYRKSS